MRRQKEVGGTVLKSRKPWVEVFLERQRRKDAHDREAIVGALRTELGRDDKSLVGNKGYRRFLTTTPGSHFMVDEDQVSADALYDGVCIPRTDTDLDAPTVALAYKTLWMVETIFRTTKSILEARPICHRRHATIRCHVFCSYLALLLKCELEERMRVRELHWEWAEVTRGLDALQEVGTQFAGKGCVPHSELRGNASEAIRGAGGSLPPPVRPIE